MGRNEERASGRGEREIIDIGGGKYTLVKVIMHFITVTQSITNLSVKKKVL